eukprot:CAMPEP_0182918222 /NCGR_PEP_ID=MMETSP0105_2-20130417/1965_1 /TAXON_ID=81532 ORGANISM="Acanthoeca-like sp., Strain 10tr" /NCGR_SAMPLE_ID=MMETSP0105_2 /ASSEMBLY_ACC=CAM_ASM_000205 /LENGTH=54 /DNA_ID=CAMNT_0025055287 /DNA_START=38 /DNA_END=199 /DNA_ORIENTATION=+
MKSAVGWFDGCTWHASQLVQLIHCPPTHVALLSWQGCEAEQVPHGVEQLGCGMM